MPDLQNALNAGGEMILSGILQEEAAEMNACCEKYGLQTIRTTIQDGWACLYVKKRDL
jgi:ribosomal protein L11 methylase PrmA